MTLEAWVNPTASRAPGATSSYKSDDDYYLDGHLEPADSLPVGGGTLRRSSSDAAFGTSALAARTPGTTSRRPTTAATLRLYVNGAGRRRRRRTGSRSQTSTGPAARSAATRLRPVLRRAASTRCACTTRALTQAQIQTDMNTPVGGGTAGTRSRRPRPATCRRRRSARPRSTSWTAATDNVGVTGYRVERCQGAGCSNFAEIAQPTGTHLQRHRAQPPRRATRYRVRATDAAGNLGPYSNTASATTPAAGHAAADGADEPAATRGQLDPDQPVLDGRDRQRRRHRLPGRALPGRRLLELRRDRAADRARPSPTRGAAASTSYRYRVRATDAAPNLGPYSTTATATTPAADTQPPTAPTNLRRPRSARPRSTCPGRPRPTTSA